MNGSGRQGSGSSFIATALRTGTPLFVGKTVSSLSSIVDHTTELPQPCVVNPPAACPGRWRGIIRFFSSPIRFAIRRPRRAGLLLFGSAVLLSLAVAVAGLI